MYKNIFKCNILLGFRAQGTRDEDFIKTVYPLFGGKPIPSISLGNSFYLTDTNTFIFRHLNNFGK